MKSGLGRRTSPAGRDEDLLHFGVIPWPHGAGRYRVQVTGEPRMTLDLVRRGADGDHNVSGMIATAMWLVNVVEAVVAAPPGLVTAADLPLITGRGLVRD